ncbi:MAG TPA: hypothetical protein VF210_14040 [Pseudomonadales bacterium]
MSIERIRRVLLALDDARPDVNVLRALQSLLDLDALEMTGLFLEDEELLRAALLPCFREISYSGVAAPLDRDRLLRDMALQARAAEEAFRALAEHLTREHWRLAHRFLVARGRFAEELDRAAAEAEFVLVTRRARGAGLRQRLGHTFANLVRQPRHVLFVNEPWASGSSVVVVNAGRTALDHAARIAETQGLRLVVANPVAVPPPAAARLPRDAVVRQLTALDEQAIADLCLREDARLLVLPELPDFDWAELLLSLTDRLPCSILKLAEPAAPPPA